VMAPHTEEDTRDPEINERSADRYDKTEAHLFQRFRREQPLIGRYAYAGRCQEYEGPFDTAREIFGLVMSEVMVIVRRTATVLRPMVRTAARIDSTAKRTSDGRFIR